jgi:hypothetical protein
MKIAKRQRLDNVLIRITPRWNPTPEAPDGWRLAGGGGGGLVGKFYSFGAGKRERGCPFSLTHYYLILFLIGSILANQAYEVGHLAPGPGPPSPRKPSIRIGWFGRVFLDDFQKKSKAHP